MGEIILKNDVLEISMYDFVDRNGPFDDNLNEPMYESWLHLQDANKTKALIIFSCELTVKWPFSHVEKVNIMAPLLCPISWTL